MDIYLKDLKGFSDENRRPSPPLLSDFNHRLIFLETLIFNNGAMGALKVFLFLNLFL